MLNYSTIFSQGNFSFLNLPTHARINGLGGENVSLSDKDINLHTTNPALLDTSMCRQIGLSYSPYMLQGNLLALNYAPKIELNKRNSVLAFNLQNLNYGTFQGTDLYGNQTTDFSANDFSIGVSYAKKIQNISFGVRTKLVGSILESYNSFALLTDWGGTFKHPKKNVAFGFLVKNVGFVLKKYIPKKPSIPFDLQLGMTFKPQFMPIRFSVTAHHLYQFDIVNNNPNLNFEYDEQGNKILKKVPFTDKLFRHFVLGSEILVHKNFNLLLGYNYLRRKELQATGLGGGSGLSFGAFIRLKKIQFSFSNSRLFHSGFSAFSLCYSF